MPISADELLKQYLSEQATQQAAPPSAAPQPVAQPMPQATPQYIYVPQPVKQSGGGFWQATFVGLVIGIAALVLMTGNFFSGSHSDVAKVPTKIPVPTRAVMEVVQPQPTEAPQIVIQEVTATPLPPTPQPVIIVQTVVVVETPTPLPPTPEPTSTPVPTAVPQMPQANVQPPTAVQARPTSPPPPTATSTPYCATDGNLYRDGRMIGSNQNGGKGCGASSGGGW